MVRHFFLMVFIVATGMAASAQYSITSKYFVYLQTEPAQPFYIRINGQQLSANLSGYLILPQLKDGNYKLVVGFPQNKFPEQTYNFNIDSKDKGYLIKDFGGAEGWGLFDLQTMAVQKPLAPGAANAIAKNNAAPPPQTVPKEDVSDFTKVLSKAANDPSLLEETKELPKPMAEEKVQEPAVTPPAEERPVEKEEVSSAPQEAPPSEANTIVPPPVADAGAPLAGSTLSTTRGTGGVMVTYDNVNEKGQPEPVTIFIPEPKEPAVVAPVKEAAPATSEQYVDTTTPSPDTEHPQSFEVEEKPAIEEPATVENNEVANTNDKCKKVADENDFLKLRRQMAQKENDDGMISQAISAFKSRCYTTAQIKYLSSMFLSNAGKYNFFEIAFPHVADTQNFSSLETELKDTYYKDKFNALMGR